MYHFSCCTHGILCYKQASSFVHSRGKHDYKQFMKNNNELPLTQSNARLYLMVNVSYLGAYFSATFVLQYRLFSEQNV